MQQETVAAASAPQPDTGIAPLGRLVAGRYRIRSLLGRGGMGRVWLAQDQLTGRAVALKQLVSSADDSGQKRTAAYASALREAQAATRVGHDGAVTIHEVVEDGGTPWIVMEPLWGRTLEEALGSAGPLPVDRVTTVGLRLLDVLRAVHRVGLVHCDVKPGNVHLCEGGRVVLADFGIASAIGEVAASPAGDFVGSPGYVAPERIRGGEVRPACDLFSLGATLFAAVEGRSPFDKGSVYDTLVAVVHDAPARFLRAGPLRPVIEGLLAKEPGRRLGLDAAETALRAVAAKNCPVSPMCSA